jgi:predicted nucleic acid-binding protein
VSGDVRPQGLIDTNIIIDLPDIDPAHLPEEMILSTVTLAELSAGPHYTDDPGERARRLRLLQHAEATFDPIPFDADAARAFGMVCAGVIAEGRKPRRRIADLMIAAVAQANRLPLYTTNPDDFRGLEKLIEIIPIARPSRRREVN